MKLEEAIEDCHNVAFRLEREGFEEWAKAVKLGIEAMKRRLEYNHKNLIDFSTLLPGETEE